MAWKLVLIGQHPNNGTLADKQQAQQPPSRPGHQGGREWSLRVSAWGQPHPQGSLRGLAAPSTTSAFALPSSIHQGMKRAQQCVDLGTLSNRQTTAAWGKPTGPAAPRPPGHHHHPPTPLHHPSGGGSGPPRLSVWGHCPTPRKPPRMPGGSISGPAAPSPPNTTSALTLLSTIHQEVGAAPSGGSCNTCKKNCLGEV